MIFLLIEPMSTSDISRVMEIEKVCFPWPWPVEIFYQEIVGNRLAYYYVARLDDEIQGYIGAWILRSGEVHITNLAVHPHYRRKGIARCLLKFLYGLARQKECHTITLEVRRSNHIAIELYRQEGFQETGIKPGYYRDSGEDAVVMSLKLDEGGDIPGQEELYFGH